LYWSPLLTSGTTTKKSGFEPVRTDHNPSSERRSYKIIDYKIVPTHNLVTPLKAIVEHPYERSHIGGTNLFLEPERL